MSKKEREQEREKDNLRDEGQFPRWFLLSCTIDKQITCSHVGNGKSRQLLFVRTA